MWSDSQPQEQEENTNLLSPIGPVLRPRDLDSDFPVHILSQSQDG